MQTFCRVVLAGTSKATHILLTFSDGSLHILEHRARNEETFHHAELFFPEKLMGRQNT